MTMDVFYEDKPCGTGAVTQEGLYTKISCDVAQVSTKVLRCYGVLGQGILPLGVLMPQGGRLFCSKKIATSQWHPWEGCRLVVAETEPVIMVEEAPVEEMDWTPWQGQLYDHTITDALISIQEGQTEVAMPYSMEEPFPYMDLFCMLTPKNIGGKMYLVCQVRQSENLSFS